MGTLARTLGLLALFLMVMPAWGQGGSGIAVEPGSIEVGLAGQVRPGQWTPLRVALRNDTSQARTVRVQWILEDIDGDEVLATRTATLSPQRTQHLWVYAPVPATQQLDSDNPGWRLRVLDDASAQVLDTAAVAPPAQVPLGTAVIAITGNAMLGLERYEENWTQHEPIQFLRGISPRTLPDRWYGLSLPEALIWLPDGGDPGDPAIAQATHQAILDWVSRGGHLVISMAAIGETWTRSPLAELLPSVRIESVEDAPVPAWCRYISRNLVPDTINMKVFEPIGDVAVVLRDEQGRPAVVAGQYGMGRVTLIGVDLSDARFRNPMQNPVNLWQPIFGWQSPAWTAAKVEADRTTQDPKTNAYLIAPEVWRQEKWIGQFLPGRIAMTATAGAALVLAMFVFAFYWFWAGPLIWGLLRYYKLSRHNWLAFLLVALIFSVLTWAGALALRPGDARIAHFSVLDVDEAGDTIHVQSWLSLFVPRHGDVQLDLEGQETSFSSTIAAMGLPGAQEAGSFVNPQRYTINAAAPGSLVLPMRATAKQLAINYQAGAEALSGSGAAAGFRWQWPSGAITQTIVRNEAGQETGRRQLTGRLSHALPGDLEQVKLIWCYGDGRAFIWRPPALPGGGHWKPGAVLDVGLLNQAPPSLLVPPRAEQLGRSYGSGYLADLLQAGTAQSAWNSQAMVQQFKGESSQVYRAIEMLTFFSMLPPPLFKQGMDSGGLSHFVRDTGRHLNLTPLLTLPRLIVLGYLHGRAPLPIPLRVDGEPVTSVDADSWIVVRCVIPLGQEVEIEPAEEGGAAGEVQPLDLPALVF